MPVKLVYTLPAPPFWWTLLDASWASILVNVLTLAVLWYTALWVRRYTVETQGLRLDNQQLIKATYQTRIEEMKPVVVFPEYRNGDLIALKNIGKGPALDVELRLSQIHTSGGLTNLRNLIGDDSQRNLLNLGVGDFKTIQSSVLFDYLRAADGAFAWGVKGVFVVLATYNDLERRPYYTMTAIKVTWNGGTPNGVIKRTKFAEYSSGETEKLVATDWIA